MQPNQPSPASAHDNIASHIARATIATATSKENKPYTYLTLHWLMDGGNTYEQRVFLSNEQVALIQLSKSAPASI